MCSTCGCDHSHNQPHNHDHIHPHSHELENNIPSDKSLMEEIEVGKKIFLEQDILGENNLLAEKIKGYCEAKSIFALNLMSSPGSGKTAILEQSILNLAPYKDIYVIEGDQQTSNDADRIQKTGIPAIQINTGSGCHLEANQVYHALKELQPLQNSLVFIENVGNLVCPAIFDIGENKRVVIISTTEGDDKPLKYPQMFTNADICIINKIDLLPYLNTDINLLKKNIHTVNPSLLIFKVSATTGEGISNWCQWILNQSEELGKEQMKPSFFDEKASSWDHKRTQDNDIINHLLDKMEIRKSDDILDCGCGTGILIPFLKERVREGKILAVDSSPVMLQRAMEKFPEDSQIQFLLKDIDQDYISGSFDKIILFSMYPHLKNKLETIKHLLSHLKEGGELIIAHDNSRVNLNDLHAKKDKHMPEALLLPVDILKKRFTNANIQVKKAYEDDFMYYIILQK